MNRHTVLIPIVDNGQDHKLWQIYCRVANSEERTEAVEQKNKSHIYPTLNELLGVQYYNKSIKPYLAAYRFLPSQIQHRLENFRLISGDGEWVTEIEGESSDLGIALCLLMACCKSKHRIIAATGVLGDAVEGEGGFDSLVKPVAGVQQKLQQLLKQAPNDLKFVFTPKQYFTKDHGKIILATVIDLPEVKALNKKGIIVEPVSKLSDAINILFSNNLYWRFKCWHINKYSRFFSCFLLFLIILAGWLGLSLYKPIDLKFVAMDKNTFAQPFIVCNEKSKNPDFVDINQNRIVSNHAEIGWLLQVGEPDESSAWSYKLLSTFGYSGVKPTLLLISDKHENNTHAIMEPDNRSRLLVPGRKWSYSWQLKPETLDEEMLLAILVNRHSSLDIEKLRHELLDSRLSLDEIEGKIRKIADGAVSFRFVTQAGVKHCDKPKS